MKAAASARTTAATKPGVAKASARTAITDKKKKKAPEAEPEAEAEAKPTSTTITEEVTIEVTISEPSEDKKGEEESPITEIPSSTSIDTTPLVDEAFTPGTAERVEEITSTETSLSKELAEKLPRLSAALTGVEGEEEEGTSVDMVDSDRLEEAEAREGEREESPKEVEAEMVEGAKDVDDERAERRKVSLGCNYNTETLPIVELNTNCDACVYVNSAGFALYTINAYAYVHVHTIIIIVVLFGCTDL